LFPDWKLNCIHDLFLDKHYRRVYKKSKKQIIFIKPRRTRSKRNRKILYVFLLLRALRALRGKNWTFYEPAYNVHPETNYGNLLR
ncbi:MAG: hypothetical protein Q8M56_17565, partial [Desulfobacterales bacterium]|nr:hypothetical protein [Desulfobacterales bacterium]